MAQQGVISSGATPIDGLTDAEVRARRAQGLGNDVRLPTGRSYREILRENVFTFINNVLFGLGIVLVALGQWSDALVSVGVVTVNLLVGVIQEVRAKQTLDRIALLTRPKAVVIRAGQKRPVDPSEIVLGDVLVVGPGDQIVVDGVVRGDGRLEADESLLSGESDLIPKTAGDTLYAGSFCMSGSGRYEAQRVGAASLASQLATQARAFRRVYTPLQQQVNLVVRIILLVAVTYGIVYGVDAIVEQLSLAESVKIAVVIAGLVPNGLFLAIAVAYAMGAVRVVAKGVLVQQANSVESLSHVDVLCLDKTGTLTTGRVMLDALYPLATSEEELRRRLGDFVASTVGGNRTTAAIAAACRGVQRSVRDEVAFSSARKWSALVLADGVPDGLKEQLVQALKDQGHYVAFIGDGVNDVLALKQADLGMALRSGSQAAGAVADLILLDDAFTALPTVFREGQRILHGMQDVLRLFLTRVLYVALLIAAIGVVNAGFPLAPKHNALLTLLTVGIPSIALAAWARPIPPPRGALVRSLLHFVLPAAWSLALVGLAVYVAYYLPARDAILRAAPGDVSDPALQAAQTLAQTALTTVSVFCGLLLILFSEASLQREAGGELPRTDWRPWALVTVLLLGFLTVVTVPTLRAFFDLAVLGLADYVLLGVTSLGWALGLRWAWRNHLLERILGLNGGRSSLV